MRYPREQPLPVNRRDGADKSRWGLLRPALPEDEDDGWVGWPAGLSPPGARRGEPGLPDDYDRADVETDSPETDSPEVDSSGYGGGNWWADDDGFAGGRDIRPGFAPAWRGALMFTREHAVVMVVALAVGVVFATMTFMRSRTDEVPLAPEISLSVAPTPEPSPATVKVHVLGAVASPGVVTLPEGARVEDAIAAAGGLTGDADPAQLNLAAVVGDGSQIVIGTTASPVGEVNDTSGGTTGGAGAKVNINTASEAELETLPGVGPVTAQKIMAYRSQHGRFSAIDQLQEVDGIGAKTMAQLEPYVCV